MSPDTGLILLAIVAVAMVIVSVREPRGPRRRRPLRLRARPVVRR